MKKKAIFILAVLSMVALPMAAMAAAPAATTAGMEFTLGGYVKMEMDWDSTQTNKNLTAPILRNNDVNFQHGRLKFTANSTRLNFTMKGPKVFGAQVTGFIEADFDAQGNSVVPGADTNGFGSFRLRHAMFRMNWPSDTELLFGQYWGYFSEFTPETAQDSGNQFTGSPTQRLPQVRVTQKWVCGPSNWVVASMLVGAPFNSAQDTATSPIAGVFQNNLVPGERSEAPQLQIKLGYEGDLWGKAPFYGVPRGFVAQLSAGWQRSQFRQGMINGRTFAQDQFATPFNTMQRDNQMLDSWIVMASMFVPIVPCYSANIAGTASISTQWYVGQGVAAFGEGIDSNSTFLNNAGFPVNIQGNWFDVYDRALMKQYGGFVQGQYYFTNQWFLNAVSGFSKVYGIPQDQQPWLWNNGNPEARTYLATQDQFKTLWQSSLTLWYRPIQSLKFGLQYSYMRTDWLQKGDQNVNTVFITGLAPTANHVRATDLGEDHRVMFAGFFYF
jgi:hypothetical protein